jgi:hypothetical protein
MLPLIIGGLIVGLGSVSYYLYKQHRRAYLEDRQLQMFIEQLVWDPDDKRYMVDDRIEILPLPEGSIMDAKKKTV